MFPYQFLLFSIQEKSIGIVKFFDFWVLTDIHVLGCFQHDFTILRKCLSVGVCYTNFVAALKQKTNGRNCMKF